MASPRLRTPRLELRLLQPTDVAPLWPYVSDESFPRYMTWAAHEHPDETTAYIGAMQAAAAEGTAFSFALIFEGQLIGLAGLHDVTRVVRAWRVDRAELGYWVGPPFQDRGLCTEAAREVMRFGFEDLGLHKITVGCITDNVPSRRVIEKLRFRFLGEQRHHAFRGDRWWNHLAYELCVDEWSGG